MNIKVNKRELADIIRACDLVSEMDGNGPGEAGGAAEKLSCARSSRRLRILAAKLAEAGRSR